MSISRYLNKEVKGFTGITHALMSVALLLVVFIFLKGDAKDILLGDLQITIIAIIIAAGAALLPDLDNDESTAGYQLGFIGTFIGIFMKTTAMMIYNLHHTKKDRPPKSAHRLFWHTPFASALIFFAFWFFMPTGNESGWDFFKKGFDGNILEFLIENTTFLIGLFTIFISAMLGSDTALYWLFKLIKIRSFFKTLINSLLPIAVLILVILMPLDNIRMLTLVAALGYFFHILGDLLTQGSVAIVWPIPIKGQAWHQPWILGPLQIYTGGVVNTMMNFVFLGIIIFAGIIVFA